MRLFDCTLRDGGNVLGNGFTPQLTVSVVRGLLAAGIDQIELGHAKGLGMYESFPAPCTDLEYMQLVKPYADRGCLGMFCLAGRMTEDIAKMAADNGLSFIRVGIAAGDGRKAEQAIKQVKAAGLICRYSLMKGYILSAEELAEEAAFLQDAGVDIITIMDSAGTMTPAQTTAYVSAMRERVSIPVGFHGHSNLGLSQANATAAVEAGAYEVDGGLLGMARSAGNCATELAAAEFIREGLLEGVDLDRLLLYLDTELIPAMAEYGYRPAVYPLDLILGMSGCHSSFVPLFRKVAEEEQVSLYRLISEVSAVDRKAPTEELMRRTAAAFTHK